MDTHRDAIFCTLVVCLAAIASISTMMTSTDHQRCEPLVIPLAKDATEATKTGERHCKEVNTTVTSSHANKGGMMLTVDDDDDDVVVRLTDLRSDNGCWMLLICLKDVMGRRFLYQEREKTREKVRWERIPVRGWSFSIKKLLTKALKTSPAASLTCTT